MGTSTCKASLDCFKSTATSMFMLLPALQPSGAVTSKTWLSATWTWNVSPGEMPAGTQTSNSMAVEGSVTACGFAAASIAFQSSR